MKVSYYPGCSLHGTAREYGESVAAVAEALGIELQELADWTCCGSSSAHIVDDGLAVALAARNLDIADRAGLDLMVPCAACFQRLKVAEKALMAGEEVEGITRKYEGKVGIKHSSDFFWEDVGAEGLSGHIKKHLKGLSPVCYYGCLTTRPPRVTDAKNPEDPQALDRLMKSLGADVRSWSHKTDCCGGNLTLTRPDITRKMTQRLLDAAEEAGANCVVAACPICQTNLDSNQAEISRETGRQYSLPVFYFTELMGLALGLPGVEKWLGRHTTDPLPLLKRLGLI